MSKYSHLAVGLLTISLLTSCGDSEPAAPPVGINAEIMKMCTDWGKASLTNSIATSSRVNLDAEATTAWCNEYSSSRSKSSSTNAGASGNSLTGFGYTDFDGNYKTSDAQSEALYQLQCESTSFNQKSIEELQNTIRAADAVTNRTVEECMASARGGIGFPEPQISETQLTMSIRSYSDNKITRVDVIPSDAATCEGDLAEVDAERGRRLPNGGTLTMTCLRKYGPNDSLAEVNISVTTESAGELSYTWPGRDACGTLDQKACTGTKSTNYPLSFPEENEAYSDRGRTITAAANRDALNAIAAIHSTSCDVQNIQSKQTELYASLLAKWDTVLLSDSEPHTCTKGYSGGTKQCGCKYTDPAPSGFIPVDVKDGVWNGTRGENCLRLSGKGDKSQTTTATWKLSDPTRDARAQIDLAYLMANASCFNGCEPGLLPDANAICRKTAP